MATTNRYGTMGGSGDPPRATDTAPQNGGSRASDTAPRPQSRGSRASDTASRPQNGGGQHGLDRDLYHEESQDRTGSVSQDSDSPLVQYLNKQILNKDTDDELVCEGYRDSVPLIILFWTLAVLTVGLLLLVMYWKPEWRIKLTKRKCPLRRADTLVLKDLYGKVYVETVVLLTLTEGPSLHFHRGITNTYSSCESTVTSKSMREYAYLESEDGECSPDVDDTTILTLKSRVYVKYFDHKHVRYMWDQSFHKFIRLRGLEKGFSCGTIHDKFKGLSEEEQAHKLQIYGENTIDVQVKSYVRLFFQEVLNPFYVFQICSVILWACDNYMFYAGCILLISAISLGVELYQTKKQSVTLHNMVMSTHKTVDVVRGETADPVETDTRQLVPGDVILIPARGCTMSCDAVLVSGTAIVNESMLTGESVPVTKTPLAPSESDETYDPDTHKRHTLFSGTQVIQTRYYGDNQVRAVVVRTGFYTAKGDLVRSILYPKPMGFKFYQDALKFIGFLACIAALGMIYTVVILIQHGESIGRVLLRSVDIVTIVVPPALPAAMTVGTAYAQSRLKKQGIFCISPARINVAGKIKLVVFDKTGTLTEEGLDLWGVVPVDGQKFGVPTQNPTDLAAHNPFIIAMATCHSLTIIDNVLCGDPLDLKMFESINWVIEEPGRDTTKFDSLMPTVVKPIHKSYGEEHETPFEVGIVRQFTFSSSLQRMSVIVRELGADRMDVYSKGAPEKIASLCKKDTLPEDFLMRLQQYTKKGYRVIAVAWKSLQPKLTWHQAQRLARDQVETDLTFLGLLIMENMLKSQTTPVIIQLKSAEIRTVMATGDNILTAVSVAHQCGMIQPKERVFMVNAQAPSSVAPAKIEWELAAIETDRVEGSVEVSEECSDQQEMFPHISLPMPADYETGRYHFALTGKSFAIIHQYFPELINKICVRGTVFARMSPDQKSQLVEHLMDLGYCVGMCGDGANDCGALKTAHTGISLSEAEASVASPFTSTTANIECVPTLIREGRAALVTSFGVFKYMALYSMVQFVTVLILYTTRTNLSDFMFLYIDLVITTTVAFLMGHTAAFSQLVAKRPPGSLVAPSNVFSVIIHIIIMCSFQTCAYFYLTTEDWYVPQVGDVENQKSFETTTLFYVSCFQYLMLAFIFSKGPPYRKPIWTNVPFLVALIVLLALTTFIVLYPLPFITKLLKLEDIPQFIFRLTLIGMATINFLLAIILENFIIPSRSFARCINSIRRKRAPKNQYKVVQSELEANLYWPPVGEITLATDSGGDFLREDKVTVSLSAS